MDIWEEIEFATCILKAEDHHIRCGDCGQFIPKHRWVEKNHPRKTHALCWDCASCYDDPYFM